MAKIIEFIKETRGELKHVSWPTRSQTVNATALVIGLSLAVALFLAFFDWLFSLALKAIIS
ncbi:MAG TPA: preprotein translocase subunit SecE [Candidatus Paceibacterota bacterium]